MPDAPYRRDDRARTGVEATSGVEGAWRRWSSAVALALLALPFVVVVIGQRRAHWFPVLDLAMTELRVSDVFTRETPLIGLPGRIGDFPDQGSHPGPLSFYALAPFYRLFGATSWALQAATAVVNLIACGVALWIGRRRGSAPMVAAVALLLAVLIRGYGIETFIEPWNPLMPLLWWVVLLLAAWSVLCGDLKLLPVAVLAASFCAQTHIPYLGLALGVGAVAVIGVGVMFLRAAAGSQERGLVLRWVAIAALVGVVAWFPPLVDQVTGSTHNGTMLARHFTTEPPEERIGFADGTDWLLVNVDPRFLIGGDDDGAGVGPLVGGGPLVGAAQDPERSPVPGLLLVLVWGAAVAVAFARPHGALLRLHAVIAAGLLLGLFSLSSVFGKQWYYLSLWTWALAALMVGTIVWTILFEIRTRLPEERRAGLGNRTGIVMFVIAAILTTMVTAGAVDKDPPDPMLSEVLGELVPATADALDAGLGAAEGRDGRYLVTWNDTYFIGSQGYGLVLELERRGFDVGVTDTFRVPVTPQRVLPFEDATAEVRLVTGFLVEELEDRPDAVEVARVDPRTPAELEEFERLRVEIIDELDEVGLDDLVPLVDQNLFAVPIDPSLPVSLERKAVRLLELGQPTAVFILPVRSR